ncbi:MAG: ATP-binding protein, partial [Actinobacteria bacterium]|nr:ATP-binding protein [Actinomycetota bacterium]
RVRAAVLNSGFVFPRQRVTANVAPADLEKAGSSFDLALACGLLAASDQVQPTMLDRIALFAELSLSGELRPCRGVLAVAEAAARAGLGGLVVARTNAAEAAQVPRLGVTGLGHLVEVTAALDGRRGSPRRGAPRRRPAGWPGERDRSGGDRSAAIDLPGSPGAAAARAGGAGAGVGPGPGDLGGPGRPGGPDEPDLADVRGQRRPIRALTVAAAGGHHLLLSGPPGVGKTMLARRLSSLLPPLGRAEALEVTKIHGIAGEHVGAGLVARRPFRAPHHSISAVGLVGGGPLALPGEAVLAHHGVLFLDELSEFSRPALEALRSPLESGRVAIVRRQRTAVYPTRFMLVAAMNPCPCGHAGDTRGRCRCTEAELARHRAKLSGPMLDRIDLLVRVARPTTTELRAPPQTTSGVVRERVLDARARQAARLRDTGATCNAELDLRLLRTHGDIDPHAEDALQRAYERGALSVRGQARALRVARTVADLDGSTKVRATHVAVALS